MEGRELARLEGFCILNTWIAIGYQADLRKSLCMIISGFDAVVVIIAAGPTQVILCTDC